RTSRLSKKTSKILAMIAPQENYNSPIAQFAMSILLGQRGIEHDANVFLVRIRVDSHVEAYSPIGALRLHIGHQRQRLVGKFLKFEPACRAGFGKRLAPPQSRSIVDESAIFAVHRSHSGADDRLAAGIDDHSVERLGERP